MGLLDSLFGGGKEKEAPKAKPKKAAIEVAADQGIPPEIIAAISASVGMVMDDDDELVAAVAAAIIHARGGSMAVRIKRTSNAWGAVGRQKLMDGRQF